MKLLNWIRFTWDLTKLPAIASELPKHYRIDPVTPEDQKELRKLFSSLFLLDPTWNPAIGEVMQTIQSWLDRAFATDTSISLALRHGTRIIGGAVLSLEPEADSHLAPGPCVSMEYRNRGFGTRLFESSLQALRDAGLTQAHGITRENAPVARFLYPKFEGVVAPDDVAVLLAA